MTRLEIPPAALPQRGCSCCATSGSRRRRAAAGEDAAGVGGRWGNLQDGAPQLYLLVYKTHELYLYLAPTIEFNLLGAPSCRDFRDFTHQNHGKHMGKHGENMGDLDGILPENMQNFCLF